MIDSSMSVTRGSFGMPGPTWGGVPSTDVRPREPQMVPETASFGRRFAAWAIDQALLIVIALILVGTIVGLAGIDLDAAEHGDTQAEEDAATAYAAAGVLGFGYFWVWNAIGYTPGKQMLGMRIVDAEGKPPGWGRGFARTVGSSLSLLCLTLGYLWMLWDRKDQTWHDKQASTFVVREQPKPR